MSTYLKPQSPLYDKNKDAYFYPLTTADQVIMENGSRLNTIFKTTVRETVTLLADNWSADAPYTQTVTVSDVNFDELNVDAHVAYTGNIESDLELNKGYSCVSYVKKDRNSITFFCLKDKPAIDMPVEIVGTSCNTMATVEEGTKLNFDIVAYDSEEELLANTPMENTIGIISDVEINGYRFSAIEPEDMVEGEVWIQIGTDSNISFDIVDGVIVYPISAKQFVGDDWLERTAMIYQNERWLAWFDGYLYNAGDECVGVTGGWVQTSYPNYSDGNIVKESNYIRLSVSSAPRAACVKTVNPINFSNYNTLSIKFSKVELMSGATAKVVVASAINSGVVASLELSNGGAGTRTVDLSNVSGAYYVFIYALRPSSSADFDVRFTEVKCE